MGIWTWLRRYDVTADELADHARFVARHDAMESEDPACVEELATHRGWHALHVALTGCEEGGPSPAADVMGVQRGTYSEWEVLRWPDEVARLADFLDGVVWADALRTLHAAVEGGACYYNEPWDDAWLTRTFEDVKRFFRAAADAGQVVVVRRL